MLTTSTQPLAGSDPLLDPDPQRVADAATMEGLLRCWVRETGGELCADGVLRLELAASATRLEVPVLYRSASGWHRFGIPLLASGAEADAATLAALLAREVTARASAPAHTGADMVARAIDSARRVAAHVCARRRSPVDPPGCPPFLAAEQALLLGHPFHPTPKSREGASEAELAALSPELRGSFPLHWFAAHPSVVASDSALRRSADQLVGSLAAGVRLPAGTVPLPAHPWQARDLTTRAGIRGLLDAGLLRDLGPGGPPWHPTSSVRTVYRPDAPVMLKLSLGLRITNSRRNNLRAELALGVQIYRLIEAGLGAHLRRVHPCFRIVGDPAWLAVNVDADGSESGLETVVRENPFGPRERVSCLAGLVAERPELGRSQLGSLVHHLAAHTSRDPAAVAAEWFARYLEVVAVPVLWLYAVHGIALEAHQQNTLVSLDAAGWPVGGWYRDNQGYYVAASRAQALRQRLPRFGDGLPAVFDDRLVDERLGYYLGINNLFGLIGAFGSQGLADEAILLRRLREVLIRVARHHRPAPGVVDALLEAPYLRCKANLFTCVDGRDELAAGVENQSIYVHIRNPLVEVRR